MKATRLLLVGMIAFVVANCADQGPLGVVGFGIPGPRGGLGEYDQEREVTRALTDHLSQSCACLGLAVEVALTDAVQVK